MKIYKRMLIFTFVALLLMLEANALVSKENCSTLTGTVVGIQGGFRKWLDVKSVKEGVIVNFRIGRDTVYTPHVGEKVKVEYCLIRGVDVAYTVTILGEPK
jgi:hypothetical protein